MNYFWLLLLVFPLGLFAQKNTTISGKVVDSETAEAIPFANVYFKGTNIGTTTDFDGFYKLSSTTPTDSLVVSYVGYKVRTKAIEKDKTQTINFQLPPDVQTLKEVVVTTKYENPAWEILRNVVDNKDKNDASALPAYEYERYNRVEIDIDNISDEFRQKKTVKKIVAALDSLQKIVGEDGKPILPIYVSETISGIYYRKNPEKMFEKVVKAQVTGVGFADNSTMSEFIANIFQEYNFYQNFLRIGNKDLVSPISSSWRNYYDYKLEDDYPKVGNENCFRISFTPKRVQDLAFTGVIWISNTTYALRRIEVTLGKEANINFVEKIKIQQELEQVGQNEGYLPSKTRVLVDVGEIKDNWAGLLAKFYTSNKNFIINKPHEPDFYEAQRLVEQNAYSNNDSSYWQKMRHDSLTKEEKRVVAMIDTIKNLPVIRTYVDIIDFLLSGYKPIGKIDLGSFLFAYANNNVEGNRIRLGFRTNPNFSKKFIFQGYGAYGTLDKRFKYFAKAEYIISRRPWTVFSMSRTADVGQVALFSESFRNPNIGFLQNNHLFNASTYWGNMRRRRAFWHIENQASIQTDLFKGFIQKITLTQQSIDALFSFEYAYPFENPKHTIQTTEIAFESRLSFGEQTIENGNRRLIIPSTDFPVLTFRYTLGLKNVLGGDFDYHKFSLKFTHLVRLGVLGRSNYTILGSYIPTTLPYILLEPHLGNQSVFYNAQAYNMMNYFEFVSDRYVSFNLTHHFDGFFFNRVPLLRRLKWREVLVANVLYGSLADRNKDLILNTDSNGNPVLGFSGLGKEPYAEIGYGIDNIFKVFRLTFMQRLSYKQNVDARNFWVFASVHIRL